MDNNIELVKSKIDIVEFIGSYVTLKKAGRNFKANCPFHQEKSPSFVVSPDRQIWHCFGSCGDGGDAIKFLMKWENITFHEALQELAKRVGITLSNVAFDDKEWSQKERITKMNFLAAEFFQYVLHKTSYGTKALEYLTGRNINQKIITTFSLGYAPSSWDSLLKFLTKKGFTTGEMEEAGLVIRSEYGKFYDRFRGRIMFPIKDVKGNIIGFSGRILEEDHKGAKYVNTPETPIYHKRESLYGIHLTKEAIKKANTVLLVEGEFDVIMPYQHGIENIVAIKGAAVTYEQLVLLKRYTSSIIFALDADEAGVEAIKRGVQLAEKQDFEIYAIEMTSGKDPDEAVQKDPIAFKKSIQSPKPIYDFLIDAIQKRYPTDDPFFKKKIGEEVLPFIINIQNPIVLSHYVKKIATILDVSQDSVEKTIRNLWRSNKKPYISRTAQKPVIHNREEMLQKQLLSIVLQNDSPYQVAEKVFTVVSPADFTYPVLGRIVTSFIEYKQKSPDKFEIQQFFQSIPTELRTVADEVLLYGSVDTAAQPEAIDRLAAELKRSSLKVRISLLLKGNEEMTEEEKNKKLNFLQEELKQVEKSLMTV